MNNSETKNMKTEITNPTLEKLMTQITKWEIEASSPYNDGWTRQHYQERLDHIRSTLNDSGKLDNHD
jgi:hypothetical protein